MYTGGTHVFRALSVSLLAWLRHTYIRPMNSTASAVMIYADATVCTQDSMPVSSGLADTRWYMHCVCAVEGLAAQWRSRRTYDKLSGSVVPLASVQFLVFRLRCRLG